MDGNRRKSSINELKSIRTDKKFFSQELPPPPSAETNNPKESKLRRTESDPELVNFPPISDSKQKQEQQYSSSNNVHFRVQDGKLIKQRDTPTPTSPPTKPHSLSTNRLDDSMFRTPGKYDENQPSPRRSSIQIHEVSRTRETSRRNSKEDGNKGGNQLGQSRTGSIAIISS